MNTRLMVSTVAVAACLALGSFSVIAGQAPRAGELWQVTPTMAMAGMNMPLPPQQVCSPRVWTRPPSGSGPDQTCVNSGFAMAGTTANWRITSQSPPSTGVGQITRNGDSYTGSI